MFAKPLCDVLQPSPLHGSSCITLSHSGLANVDILKRMFYPLINILGEMSAPDCQFDVCDSIDLCIVELTRIDGFT